MKTIILFISLLFCSLAFSQSVESFEQQIYPNPFNQSTTIKLRLDRPDHVIIEIYNTLGQKIVTLVDNDFSAGPEYTIKWFPQNLASGVYLCVLKTTTQQIVTKRMVLVK